MPDLRFRHVFVDVALLLQTLPFFPPRQVLKPYVSSGSVRTHGRLPRHVYESSSSRPSTHVCPRPRSIASFCSFLFFVLRDPAVHLCICGTKRSGVRDFCRRDAQQCPNVGVDVLLDVSVTRLATFTRMYDAVNFPLLFFAISRTPCRDVCIRSYDVSLLRSSPYRAPLPWCLHPFLCNDMWHVF